MAFLGMVECRLQTTFHIQPSELKAMSTEELAREWAKYKWYRKTEQEAQERMVEERNNKIKDGK
jgi:hypothetical protein